MNRSTPTTDTTKPGIDLTLVAQRILKLADLSVLEHLEAIARSQAEALANLANEQTGRAERSR
jgi:hypothetical protein